MEQPMSQADSNVPLDVEKLNALSVRLTSHADTIRNPAAAKTLGADLRLASNVASEHASWRFALSELAASLPAGTHARIELLKLLGEDMLASSEPAFYAILYDIRKECDAPAFPRLAHVGIETLEQATELVSAEDGQGEIYRAGNAVIAECRAIATSASGTDLWASLRSKVRAMSEAPTFTAEFAAAYAALHVAPCWLMW
jgi:hypothetical protein